MDKNNLLGVGVTNASNNEILEYIINTLKKGDKKYYIVTPNPEILVYAANHQSFKSILNNARLALPDGTGVIWAGKILGKTFKEKVTGTDLLENLCKVVHEKPITVGFLGAGPKIAEKVAECLVSKYPKLRVVFAGSEWCENDLQPSLGDKIYDLRFKKKKGEFINRKSYIINQPNIDILFVAYGFPKQEEWMAKNIDQLPVKITMGVGGAFDYISGKVSRAPQPIRKAGFEWFYRLVRQPWRIKRQLALVEFIYLVFKEKFKSKR